MRLSTLFANISMSEHQHQTAQKEPSKRKRSHSLSTKSSHKASSSSIPSIPSTPTSFTSPSESAITTIEASPLRLTTILPATSLDPTFTRAESPRTKVAWNFQGLHLGRDDEMAACITPRKSTSPTDDVQEVKRRMRTLEGRDREIPETPRAFAISIGPERNVDQALQQRASLVTLHNEVDPIVFKSAKSTLAAARTNLSGTYPSINRLANSESRDMNADANPRKRPAGVSRELSLFGAGDATHSAQAAKNRTSSTSLEPPVQASAETVMQPIDRRALTWHDDEITGHDPNDPDDDGEGINGIGFKPTPAIAYHRTEARKRQMAEYKAREAREARARRGERRRGGEREKHMQREKDKEKNKETDEKRLSRDEEETERRVRFLTGSMETDKETINIGLAL